MPAAVLSYITLALQFIPVLISAGTSVDAWVTQLIADIKGFSSNPNGEPTAAQWAAMNAQMMAALTALQAAKPTA